MPDNVPTEPGFYWHRQIDEGSQEVFEWEVVRVLSEQDGPGIVINGTTFQAEEISAVWGPRIPDPDETGEQDQEAEALRPLLVEGEIMLQPVRDRFAAFALAGLIAKSPTEWPIGALEKAARESYQFADAMMAEREK